MEMEQDLQTKEMELKSILEEIESMKGLNKLKKNILFINSKVFESYLNFYLFCILLYSIIFCVSKITSNIPIYN